MKRFILALAVLFSTPAAAEDIGCVDSAWSLFKNHQICVVGFDDPRVPGVTCHVSQARTGGIGGLFGFAEDPARFSIACRQTGPIAVDIKTLPKNEVAFQERTSILFKKTNVYRMLDIKNNTLIYLAMSEKLVDGSPQNSISTVPIMPWGAK